MDTTTAAAPPDEQQEFLARWLPAPPARVLDAGCGRGALAAALAARGYRVTAVDTDPDAVAAARAGGVDAVRADVAEFTGGPFDAVVFSLSLHHVDRLDAAVARAGELLAPGGVLLVDEFGWEGADGPTAAWFADAGALLGAAGLLRPGADRGPVADPLPRWRRHHGADEPMHRGADVLRAVRRVFDVVSEERPPHLHRYLAGLLDPAAPPRVRAVLREVEALRVARGELRPLGLRLVARRAEAAA